MRTPSGQQCAPSEETVSPNGPEAAAAKQCEEPWAEIERDIRAALACNSAPSLARLEVRAGPAGVLISGVVVMPYEAAMAELVGKRHSRGMPLFSRVQVSSQPTAPLSRVEAQP